MPLNQEKHLFKLIIVLSDGMKLLFLLLINNLLIIISNKDKYKFCRFTIQFLKYLFKIGFRTLRALK